MSDYMKQRLANIARNEAALAALKIPTLPKKQPRWTSANGRERSARASWPPARRARAAASPPASQPRRASH